jgi:hypothetical protein
MGIGRWVRSKLFGEEAASIPSRGLRDAAMGRAGAPAKPLGEYDARSYPGELKQLLHRREEVAEELLSIDVSSREARQAAVDKLKQLLHRYPHPLAYEMLVQAYIDAGRWDEAKGVAYAARERRIECERSPYPEIRAETDRLSEWSPGDVDALRAEREGNRAQA